MSNRLGPNDPAPTAQASRPAGGEISQSRSTEIMHQSDERKVMPSTANDWSHDVFNVMKDNNIRQVATVPDGGLTSLLRLCEADGDINVVTLTTEEEGVAFVCGAWLGGQRATLFMQSSGVGNCLNMLSLPDTCRIPCLMLVTMRGEWKEFNPWQIPMGRAVPTVLEELGVTVHRPAAGADIGPTFERAANLAYNSGLSAVVVVSQQIVGAKNFDERH